MPTSARDEALLEALRQSLAALGETADGLDPPTVIIAQNFISALAGLGHRTSGLDTAPETAERIGREAAEQAVVACAWDTAVGERIDTTEASRLLDVSRQALAKRQSTGSLVGLPGRRTSWYPTWQFDYTERRIRPEVTKIVAAFREHLDEADPVLIAAWATTPQADLGDRTPAQWLADRRDEEQLMRAASRAAVRLAQ